MIQEKEDCEDLKISLHKAEDTMNSLAAAVAASTSSGLAFIITNNLHIVEQGNTDFPDQFDTFAVHLATCISQR